MLSLPFAAANAAHQMMTHAALADQKTAPNGGFVCDHAPTATTAINHSKVLRENCGRRIGLIWDDDYGVT